MGQQFRYWMSQWAWGGLSAASVVHSAEAFQRDGHRDAHVDRLLSSCSSRTIQNADRALQRLLPVSQCKSTEVPNSKVKEVILPADWLKWVSSTTKHKFVQKMGAEEGGLESWWQSLKDTKDGAELWSSHTHLRTKTPADLKYHLPVVLHEDAVPISKHQSAYVRSWSSILGMGKETDTKYMICSYLKAVSDHPDRSWPLVLASFDELANPSPGTWGVIVLFVTGDLDFVCNDLGLPHFNSNQHCALCCANVSDKPHNNDHNDARWRNALQTNDEFKAALRRPLHPLVA